MISCFSKKGIKKKAEKIIGTTLNELKQEAKKNPQYLLTVAIKKIAPLIHLKKKVKVEKYYWFLSNLKKNIGITNLYIGLKMEL